MTKCYIDIETIPAQPEDETKALIAETVQPPGNMSKAETIAEWHAGAGKYAGVKDALIEEQYRKTSFNAAKGEIISLAWAVEDSTVAGLCRNVGDSEADLLAEFFAVLKSELNGRPPFFIGHYIGGFDLKFIFQRAVILGVKPPFELPFNGRHNQHFFDTMTAWAGYKDTISLDNLCAALGIPGKSDEIDGSKVWDFVKAGDVLAVRDYNIDDVHKARLVYNRINFIK